MPKGEFGTEGRRFSIARPRVLLVNAYFDDLRREGGRPFSAPQSIGPTYLAGAFHAVHCEVRLYNRNTAARSMTLVCSAGRICWC